MFFSAPGAAENERERSEKTTTKRLVGSSCVVTRDDEGGTSSEIHSEGVWALQRTQPGFVTFRGGLVAAFQRRDLWVGLEEGVCVWGGWRGWGDLRGESAKVQ